MKASPEIEIVDRTSRYIDRRTDAVVVTVTWSLRVNGEIVHSLHGSTARESIERLAAHLRARFAAGHAHLHCSARTRTRTRADGWNPRDGGGPA